MRRLIDCTPFVGSALAYGSALQNYQISKLKEDIDGTARAREDAAIALADLAVDMSLAGSFRFGARSIQKLTGSFLATRAARKWGIEEIDLISPLARKAAGSAVGGAAMDCILETSRRAVVSLLLGRSKAPR